MIYLRLKVSPVLRYRLSFLILIQILGLFFLFFFDLRLLLPENAFDVRRPTT